MKSKKIIKTITILSLWLILAVNVVQAASLIKPDTGVETNKLAQEMAEGGGLQTVPIGTTIATVIKGFLGLLGIIFVILVLIAGWNYLNARGNDEKITKALDTLRQAVIGLIIVCGAYAITYFVFQNLPGGSDGPNIR